MSNSLHPKLDVLTALFKELPGVGQKGAERILFSILKWPKEKIIMLGEKISSLPANISKCTECGNISEPNKKCLICESNLRDSRLICIVEDFTQIQNIEKAGYRGLYHVLDGRLSPLENVNLEKPALKKLTHRIKHSQAIEEIIIALSQDIEGQATAIYIAELLKEYPLKITTIAKGVPAGSDLSFASSDTLAAAISGRISL